MVSQLVISLRKSSAIQRLKGLIPQPIRQLGWRMAQRQEEFSVFGSRMYLPAHARNRDLMLDCYEPEVRSAIEQHLKPGMIFVDVGANLGVFTLLAARLVGSGGKVFAFEPMPDNFDILKRNVGLNGLSNVTLLRKAVASKSGTATLFLSSFCGNHSLAEAPNGATGRSLEIETVRLDGIPELTRIDLLKIDVEGGELEALESLGALPVSKVLLEYNDERVRKRGFSGDGFLDHLRKLGFDEITNIDAPEHGLKPIRSGEDVTVNLLISRPHTR